MAWRDGAGWGLAGRGGAGRARGPLERSGRQGEPAPLHGPDEQFISETRRGVNEGEEVRGGGGGGRHTSQSVRAAAEPKLGNCRSVVEIARRLVPARPIGCSSAAARLVRSLDCTAPIAQQPLWGPAAWRATLVRRDAKHGA